MSSRVMERGFECSDMSSFYSSITGGSNVHVQGDIITMMHGQFKLCKIEDRNVFGYSLETLAPTWLYDVVVRHVVSQDYGYAKIADEDPVPLDIKYHQHVVKECQAENLRFRIVESVIPDMFRQEMYIRAAGDKWIVHARAMSHSYDQLVLKHTKTGMSEPFRGTKEEMGKLWRRREIDGADYPTQIQPHCLVPPGVKFKITVEVKYV